MRSKLEILVNALVPASKSNWQGAPTGGLVTHDFPITTTLCPAGATVRPSPAPKPLAARH